MRVKNLLIKGLFNSKCVCYEANHSGWEQRGAQLIGTAEPGGKVSFTALGNRKPRVSEIFCQLNLKDRSKPL